MDNRYTPFGYHVKDGAISIAETEAAIIRQIFSDHYPQLSEVNHKLDFLL